MSQASGLLKVSLMRLDTVSTVTVLGVMLSS